MSDNLINKESKKCKHDEKSLSRVIAITERKCKNFTRALLKEYGLENVIPPYLFILHFHPGMSQDYVSNALKINKGAVAKSIKSHIENGYIYKEIDPNDKRKYKLYLTEKGNNAIPLIFDIKEEFDSKLSEILTQEEIESTYSSLNKIIACLDY